MNEFVLGYTVIGIIIAVVVLGYYIYFWNKLKLLKKLEQRFGGKAKLGVLYARYRGGYKGREFVITLLAPSRYSPPELELEFYLPGESPFSLEISKEDGISKFFKKVGPIKEIDTGYPEFDKEFFIRTNNKQEVLNLLWREEIRNTILQLFGLRIGGFIVHTSKLRIVIVDYRKAQLEPSEIEAVLEKLYLISRSRLG